MIIERWPDHHSGRDRFEAREVDYEVTFSQELLDQADGEHLIYDGQTITLDVDNGRWIWRVIEVDPVAKTVLGRWPD